MRHRLVAGWKLDRAERQRLVTRFAPAYAQVIADHVTLRSGTNENTPLPEAQHGEIIGIADDGEGLQALVVQIGGTTDRGDGNSFHITWSLDPAKGRDPVQSNDVIRKLGWRPLPEPVRLGLEPRYF